MALSQEESLGRFNFTNRMELECVISNHLPHYSFWLKLAEAQNSSVERSVCQMSRARTINQVTDRQKEGDLIDFSAGEYCGWSGRSRLERLSSKDQFVGQMDRPSTRLHSIRSQEIVPLSLRYDEAKHPGRACPSQTLLIPLGGFL